MTKRLEALCRDHGLRMNGKRSLILQIMDEANDHPTVEDVYKRVIARDHDISIATVYRTLNLLADAGLLARLELGDGRARYEEADGRRHEHLVDVHSGDVVEFREPSIEQLIRETAERLGYRLLDYRLELFGECRDGRGDQDLRWSFGLPVEPAPGAKLRLAGSQGRKRRIRKHDRLTRSANA